MTRSHTERRFAHDQPGRILNETTRAARRVRLRREMGRPAISDADVLDMVRRRFRHADLRPGQKRAMDAVLEGHDVLAVLPTGAGKSLIFQVASQLLSGLTLVVSPLLALMKDQLDSLVELGIDARAINSLQSNADMQQTLDDVARGATKLLYVTPERFDDSEFVTHIRRAGVSLFVLDEAHAISDWGHSFRPAYLTLPGAIERVGRPPVLALTATATRWVQRDIIERLRMRDPVVVVSGTDRPNLFLEVIRVEEEQQDKTVLQDLFSRDLTHGSGIIYTATTRAAQDTATWLRSWGVSAEHYHGRLKKSERERVQAMFMDDQIRVVVATNAFGLGVDKPDVRFVIHRDSPASLEAYYQEAGRAGRDGQPARCVLIYRPGDLGRAGFLAGTGQLTRDDVTRAQASLRDRNSVTARDLQNKVGLGRAEVLRLVDVLKAAGVLSERRGRLVLKIPDFDPESISLEQEESRRAYERSRLEMMRNYAELRECRRRYILNYFGEDPEWERCDRCDVDVARPDTLSPTAPDASTDPFAVNDPVVHTTLGQGIVQHVAPDAVTVLFDKAGYKTLDLDLVRDQHLLHKVP